MTRANLDVIATSGRPIRRNRTRESRNHEYELQSARFD